MQQAHLLCKVKNYREAVYIYDKITFELYIHKEHSSVEFITHIYTYLCEYI